MIGKIFVIYPKIKLKKKKEYYRDRDMRGGKIVREVKYIFTKKGGFKSVK